GVYAAHAARVARPPRAVARERDRADRTAGQAVGLREARSRRQPLQRAVERGHPDVVVARLGDARDRAVGEVADMVDAVQLAVEDVDAVAVGADPDPPIARLQRAHRGGMREPVADGRRVAQRAKRARRRVVARHPLAPRSGPDDAGAVAENGADAIGRNGAVERGVVAEAVDDLQRLGFDDVDAAAERGDPDFALRFREAVDPEVTQLARRKGAQRPGGGIEHRRAVLRGADPDAAARVFVDFGDVLAVERHLLEVALQAGTRAGPDVAAAVDEEAARLLAGNTLETTVI